MKKETKELIKAWGLIIGCLTLVYALTYAFGNFVGNLLTKMIFKRL